MSSGLIHRDITEASLKFPDKTAIKHGDSSLSYLELESLSNEIAHTLMSCSTIGKNIVLMFENSIDLIGSILGVMKFGGVFIPIDPAYPEERIRLMIDKVDADVIITKSTYLNLVDKLLESSKRTINIVLTDTDTVPDLFSHRSIIPKSSEGIKVFPEAKNDNCYIYFTSGSTNIPKAILGRHKSLKHFIDWEIKEFDIDETYITSQLVSPSFDPYLRDVFVPLFVGATICIPENRGFLQNMKQLKMWIETENITLIHTVPSLFKMLMGEVNSADSLQSLKYIMLAGELLRGIDVKKFTELFENRIQLVNLYGPTETTLAKLYYRISQKDVNRLTIPLGKAIDKAQALLIDENMNLCPMGNIGEIYIRTPYISAGYYKDKELTAKAFMPNPFTDNRNDIIYKTGDKGKLLPSGDIDIVGRIDDQIKINGIRIEPSEIEYALMQITTVKDAVVIAKGEEDEDKALTAYYISTEKVDISKIKTSLENTIPKAMMPSFFVPLDSFPKLPNGKIDKKSLPDPKVMSSIRTTYEKPINDIEKSLIGIWEDVLQMKGIGRKHNYFELGGNSINSLKVISLIHERMGIEFSLGELFLNPILSDLAQNLTLESELNKLECVVRLNNVTKTKKNLFILHTIDGTVFGYRDLAKLLEKDFNVYGIQAKGLAKECILPDSIEELAAYYLVEIQKIQPVGPYLIGGHCFGVMFGYALVHLMEETGIDVDKFIVFDEQVWFDKKQMTYVAAKSWISKAIKQLAIRSRKMKTNLKVGDFVYRYYEDRLSENQVRKSSKDTNIQENFRYLENEKYKFYSIINASILAIKADDSVWQKFTQAHWDRMTWGDVKIANTDGDHWNLFSQPHVNRLANVLKENL